MTQAQIDALRKCEDLLTEHFDGYIVGVSIEGDSETMDNLHFSRNGGLACAIGLFRAGEVRLLRQLEPTTGTQQE